MRVDASAERIGIWWTLSSRSAPISGPVARWARGVGLTFDDGPAPGGTPGVLEARARTGTPATFFVLGAMVAHHGELLEAMIASGASIGVHSWDHVDLTGQSRQFVDDQLSRTVELLDRYGVNTDDVPPALRVLRRGGAVLR